MTWFNTLTSALKLIGFTQSKVNLSLFFKKTSTSTIYLLVYVDDIIIIGSDEYEVHTLNNRFALKCISLLSFFLDIGISYLQHRDLLLTQSKYARELLVKIGMDNSKPSVIHMFTYSNLSAYGRVLYENPTYFRSIVGTLQYLTITRLDLFYVVNIVSQFNAKLIIPHWYAIKHILRYQKRNIMHDLVLRSSSHLLLQGFSKSNWGGSYDDRRSKIGLLYHRANLIQWSCKKETNVYRLRTEVE